MAEGGFAARAVGAIQIIGGGLEVALGVGGIIAPEPATTIGGVILVAHGTDTIVAGFRSLWHGEVQASVTQQGAQAAAIAVGASPQTARRIGIGVDVTAGLGPSIAMSISRRLAIAGAQHSSNKVAVAYLHRSALEQGHNAVGVTVNNSTAWYHFAYTNPPHAAFEHLSQFGTRAVQKMGFAVTELAVTGAQAGRAHHLSQQMLRGGESVWRTMGPNCTTTTLQVLNEAGVVIPVWARSPFLLYSGVRFGTEITIAGGAAATTVPALASQ